MKRKAGIVGLLGLLLRLILVSAASPTIIESSNGYGYVQQPFSGGNVGWTALPADILSSLPNHTISATLYVLTPSSSIQTYMYPYIFNISWLFSMPTSMLIPAVSPLATTATINGAWDVGSIRISLYLGAALPSNLIKTLTTGVISVRRYLNVSDVDAIYGSAGTLAMRDYARVYGIGWWLWNISVNYAYTGNQQFRVRRPRCPRCACAYPSNAR